MRIVHRQSSSMVRRFCGGASDHTDNKQQALTPLYLPVRSKTCKTQRGLCILSIRILCLCVSTVFGVFLYFARHTLKKQLALRQYLPDQCKTCMISCGLGILCIWHLFQTPVFCVFFSSSKHMDNKRQAQLSPVCC